MSVFRRGIPRRTPGYLEIGRAQYATREYFSGRIHRPGILSTNALTLCVFSIVYEFCSALSRRPISLGSPRARYAPLCANLRAERSGARRRSVAVVHSAPRACVCVCARARHFLHRNTTQFRRISLSPPPLGVVTRTRILARLSLS